MIWGGLTEHIQPLGPAYMPSTRRKKEEYGGINYVVMLSGKTMVTATRGSVVLMRTCLLLKSTAEAAEMMVHPEPCG